MSATLTAAANPFSTVTTTNGTQNTDTTGNSSNTGNQAGSTTNQYGANQQALQSQLPSLYQSLLAGNIPSSFTAPQAAIDNYNQQFQNWTAPQLALKGGAGSPMIAANQAMGLSNLMSNLYQQGVGNYTNALGSANQNAFQAIGANTTGNTSSTGTTAGTNDTTTDQTQTQTNPLLQQLLQLIGPTLS